MNQLTAHQLYEHCMLVYNGQMDIDVFAVWLRQTLGWWVDQARPFIQLCQMN